MLLCFQSQGGGVTEPRGAITYLCFFTALIIFLEQQSLSLEACKLKLAVHH